MAAWKYTRSRNVDRVGRELPAHAVGSSEHGPMFPTLAPGVTVYTGGKAGGIQCSGGTVYTQYSGFLVSIWRGKTPETVLGGSMVHVRPIHDMDCMIDWVSPQ